MDLLTIKFDQVSWALNMSVSAWLLLVTTVVTFGILGIKWYIGERWFAREFDLDEAELGIGNGKFKFRPNEVDSQIAYKLWVELTTRKIGIPIDFENDVIVEIYDSWFEFFKLTRELIKEIPVRKVRNNDSTSDLVHISVDVLNEGMRPHLTKWQAKFRSWYLNRQIKNSAMSPQEIQKKFPKYRELVRDMKEVNKRMASYANKLRELAMNGKEKRVGRKI